MGCRLGGETIIPYPNNCRKYVICETTRAKVIECLKNEVFNNNRKACVDEKTANCTLVPSTLTNLDSVSARGNKLLKR